MTRDFPPWMDSDNKSGDHGKWLEKVIERVQIQTMDMPIHLWLMILLQILF